MLIRIRRRYLFAEQLECLLTRATNFFVHACRPRLHFFVHPVTAGFAVDDADAFADRVEDELGLLGDQGPFEGEKIAGVGEDGVELIVAEGFDGAVDVGGFDDVAVGFEGFEKVTIGG